MATLTNDDYSWIVDWIRASQYRQGLKQSGLSKTQLFGAIQAIETYSVGSYNSTPTGTLKAAINTATGTTTTLQQDQALWFSWAAWKAFDNQQGA